MTLFIGAPSLQKVLETIGPIVLREVSKPRFRRFVEEKVGDLAIELARKRFSPKTKTRKEFITRRGRQRFRCRLMS